jgi:hypothetical protein
LNVANNDPDATIYKFLRSNEPPTYSYSRYLDWVKPYLKERIENSIANANIGTYKQELEIAFNVMSIYESLEKKCENEDYFK